MTKSFVLNEKIPGCDKCGASARSMFYEIMEDDKVGGHQCKESKFNLITTIKHMTFVILFWMTIFMLGVALLSLYLYIPQ